MIKTKNCQYCGKEIPLESVGCIHCHGAIAAKPGVAVLDQFAAVKSALSAKYEIIAEIGHGGNATVYQAIQKNLDRKVALKVLLPDLVNDPGYLERFHLEARAIAKLRHPNIVTIYDEGNEEGVHFIAMEFLEGKDLHQLVKEKGRLSVPEAVEMATGIANALDFAHSYGIVHRDVKSSNIIMTSRGTAVLTDFGIAQSGVRMVHTKSGSLLGTPEFMSPEQAGGKDVDSRTDFYSLGVVLYHTLSGHYPFQGESPITTIHKILFEKPVPLTSLVNLPPALERAVESCLVKDPEKRIRNGKALIEMLKGDSSPKTASAPAAQVPDSSSVPARHSAPASVEAGAKESAPRTGEMPPERPVPKSGEIAARRSPHPPRSEELKRQLVARRRNRTIVRAVVCAVVACLALAGIVAWQRAPLPDVVLTAEQAPQPGLPERRLVPYVIGATQDEATKLLKREGFEVGRIRAVAVPNPEQRGKVDSQRPPHGSLATPGATVDLLIGE